mgnify:CR=1 FL=1|jgi:transcriptional regulator with XRE-family HTH domain
MSASTAIKQRLSDLNISQSEFARLLGTTRQNIYHKLQRDNFSSQELDQICKILNMKLVMIDKDKNEYLIEYDQT